MRNYVELWWNNVYYAPSSVSSYNQRVWVGQTELEAVYHRDFYLNFLQTTFPADGWFIAYQTPWPDPGVIPPDAPPTLVDGPVKYYCKLDKEFLWKLCYGPQEANLVAADCAQTIFGAEIFPEVFTPDSPRKTWSHGH